MSANGYLDRDELTDDEWERLKPLLWPLALQHTTRYLHHRTVINAVLYRMRTGCPWHRLPEGYGNWRTIYQRHRRWTRNRTWDAILNSLGIE
ncbi:transposase [Nonomuraea sp. NPDC049504]|uniref:transposase n=1 Tax=Nonomuraea sp. NPDC049504 TaxID=3154729 RepID=UPI00341B8B06